MGGMITLQPDSDPEDIKVTEVGWEPPTLPTLDRLPKREVGCCDFCEDRDEVRFGGSVTYLQMEAHNGSVLTLCPACEAALLYVLLKNYVKRVQKKRSSFVLLTPPPEEVKA